MPTSQMNIYTLLDQLKDRKAMFLGNGYNFQSLDSFINGFIIAASNDQLQLNNYPNFNYFSTWLLGHLDKHYGLSGGWHWQITNRNLHNDETAFEDFFALLEIFKQSKIHSKSVVLDKAALDFNKTSSIKRFEIVEGREIPIAEKPFKIVWTTIDNSTTVWLDYIDQYGTASYTGIWTVGTEEAMHNLTEEFGSFQNKWTHHT